MKHRTDLWTILIVTAVTLLIWYWAAVETRVERPLPMRLDFVVSGPQRWEVIPRSISITVVAEGSQRAIRQAEQLRSLEVPLPANTGRQTIDVFETIRQHAEIDGTGIVVVSTDRNTLDVDLDEIVNATAQVVLAATPGLEPTDTPVLTPPHVEISLPSRLLRPGPPLRVEATIDPERLAGLQPGVRHVVEIPISLPGRIATNPAVTVAPNLVTAAFTLRSLIRAVSPPVPVRVQVAGSPEDDYRITLEPKQLRDVTVTVPEDLARQIESGEATVFAIVYLKSTEKEARIAAKPVSFFIALRPGGQGQVVDATVEGLGGAPEIAITIEEREGGNGS